MTDVLIVDDEYLIRTGFRHLADWVQYGYRIVGEASGGEEALRLAEELRPQIVVTDIKMPGMNGIELASRLKARFPDIHVIVLSGYDDYAYLRDSFRAGVCDYVLKSRMNKTDLLAALDLARRQDEMGGLSPSEVFIDFVSLSQPLDTLDLLAVAQEVQRQAKLQKDSSMAALRGFYLLIGNYLCCTLSKMGLHPFHLQREIREWSGLIGKAEDPEQFAVLMQSRFADWGELIDQWREKRYGPAVEQVIEYMHRNIEKEISLSDAADLVYLNPSYLSQLFKKRTGETFSAYFAKLRVEKAKDYLRLAQGSVREVCEKVGYGNQSYFAKIFRYYVGMTPKEYRDLYKS